MVRDLGDTWLKGNWRIIARLNLANVYWASTLYSMPRSVLWVSLRLSSWPLPSWRQRLLENAWDLTSGDPGCWSPFVVALRAEGVTAGTSCSSFMAHTILSPHSLWETVLWGIQRWIKHISYWQGTNPLGARIEAPGNERTVSSLIGAVKEVQQRCLGFSRGIDTAPLGIPGNTSADEVAFKLTCMKMRSNGKRHSVRKGSLSRGWVLVSEWGGCQEAACPNYSDPGRPKGTWWKVRLQRGQDWVLEGLKCQTEDEYDGMAVRRNREGDFKCIHGNSPREGWWGPELNRGPWEWKGGDGFRRYFGGWTELCWWIKWEGKGTVCSMSEVSSKSEVILWCLSLGGWQNDGQRE